jgi:EamA domain-containing membrane protein RarD
MGRTIVVLGLIIGFSALGLLRNPIGGALEVSAILTFDAVFLLSLIKAFVYARRRQIALHREWMTRAMSVALGVATVRPIMGVFFATSRLTGLTPHEFFGLAFWTGFVATYVAGEAWIRCRGAN